MMKKALIILLVLVAAIMISSASVMAFLDQKPITVDANVAKYAKITPFGGPLNLGAFTGAADEERVDGTGAQAEKTTASYSVTIKAKTRAISEQAG